MSTFDFIISVLAVSEKLMSVRGMEKMLIDREMSDKEREREI
jgi:hypothetical protein